jgi:hypothetical protein
MQKQIFSLPGFHVFRMLLYGVFFLTGQCRGAEVSEVRFDHVCDLGMETTQAFLQDRD